MPHINSQVQDILDELKLRSDIHRKPLCRGLISIASQFYLENKLDSTLDNEPVAHGIFDYHFKFNWYILLIVKYIFIA